MPIIVIAATRCASPTEPLEEYLLGGWDLVDIRGDAVPGFVRSCGWTMTAAAFGCDSTYVAMGRVAFQPAGACEWTLVSETDTLRLEGADCRYGVTSGRGWIALRGDAPKVIVVSSGPSGRYLTVVFGQGCPDLDFDPCDKDWWGFRSAP
jgi:hypothetical protein